MDRTHGQRLDPEPLEGGEGPVELERHCNGPSARGCENAHRLRAQAPQHERHDLGRARIDPLHVVQSEEKRPILSKSAHHREQREPEQPHLRRRPVRLPHQQRGLERAPLNGRQLRQRLLDHRGEHVADGCERDLRLGVGRTGREDAEAAFPREPVRLLPERGLADPGVTLEQQCLATGRHDAQERIERLQLLAPADDLDCHRTCPP